MSFAQGFANLTELLLVTSAYTLMRYSFEMTGPCHVSSAAGSALQKILERFVSGFGYSLLTRMQSHDEEFNHEQ
jgi:hypothetical protein